jgi:hypothetical protein
VPKLTHFLGEIRCQNGTQQLVVELPPEKYAKVNSDHPSIFGMEMKNGSKHQPSKNRAQQFM